MVVKIVYHNDDIEYYESDSVVYRKDDKELSINKRNKISLNDTIRGVFVNGDRIYTSKKICEEIKEHFNNLPATGLGITGELLGVSEDRANGY